jgi:hypothetical protein
MLRTISCIALVLGFLGLIGTGYVDVKLRLASQQPDLSRQRGAPLEYKGQVRFVSPMDAKIDAVAVPLAFGGVGAGVLAGLISYIIARRRS